MKRCDDPAPPIPDDAVHRLLARYADADPDMMVECNAALVYCLCREVRLLREILRKMRPVGRN